mgnify:CR=1 FL=1
MTDHLLLKNARLPGKKDLLTISITNGAIIAIQPTKESAGANYYDLDGAFVVFKDVLCLFTEHSR